MGLRAIAILAICSQALPAAWAETVDLTAPALSSDALAMGARASKLIGSVVYARNDQLGTVDDVIFDIQRTHVLAVVVAMDELFGAKLIAVPPAALKVGLQDHLTIDLPIDAFRAAPEFTYSDKTAQE